jgi:hypothetical protein
MPSWEVSALAITLTPIQLAWDRDELMTHPMVTPGRDGSGQGEHWELGNILAHDSGW